MNILMILTGPPYGSENVYNGLRLGLSLIKGKSEVQLRLFLMGDAVVAGLAKQDTPKEYYNLERMLTLLMKQGAVVKACGTCIKARGIAESYLVDGVQPSTMTELAEWTRWADKVLNL
ncbi:MAG: DsrE/DsrF/TusD sulfur relay family protein [Candidatus Hermodarchaeia archaeon]|jgi:uncharacterized protein involved in oxidation of intracellular sulfur